MSDVVGYVALGANIGDREANLRAGMAGMTDLGLPPTRRSSVWETEPVGTREPRWFLNMVVQIRTSRAPSEVLEMLLEIEQRVGRTRTGVRMLYDYLPRNILEQRSLEDILEMERRHCHQDAFIDLGRYIHVLSQLKT